jgi:hypothetical protein
MRRSMYVQTPDATGRRGDKAICPKALQAHGPLRSRQALSALAAQEQFAFAVSRLLWTGSGVWMQPPLPRHDAAEAPQTRLCDT